MGGWGAAGVVLTAEPSPLVRLVAQLHAHQLALLSLLASALVLAVVAMAVRRRRPAAALRAAPPLVAATAVATALALTFSVVLTGSYVLRARARDVRLDALEQADKLPGGAVVPSVSPARAVVWAVGDGPDGRTDATAVADLIAADHPDHILYLGDVYGPYSRQMTTAFGTATRFMSPTPGNHEWPGSLPDYKAFWAAQGEPVSAYYRFAIAGWDVLSLNSEIPHTEDSAQMRWLRRQVADPGTCRIAFWHRPRFSAGRHGDQPDTRPLWGAVAGRAALVLNGHDHDMQRMKEMRGTTEIVVGSGGHGHYALHEDDRLAFGDDTHFGALRLVLRPGEARYRFVATDGTVLDQGRLPCTPAG